MNDQAPKHILCAVRSRPGGEETVDRAIALALRSGARLTFCQVIDIGFIDRFSRRGSARKTAYKELTDMAEFALSILCHQAGDKGVSAVDYIVRAGDVRETLLDLVAETGADVVVLGRPKKMPGRSAFSDQSRQVFIAQLEATGAIVDG